MNDKLAPFGNDLDDELARFKDVIAARRTVAELFGLYEKLLISPKFSEEVKPECLFVLTQACLNRMADKDIRNFLIVTGRSNAFDRMRFDLEPRLVAKLGAEVAKRTLLSAPKTSEGYMAAMQGLEYAGISYSRTETMDLCHWAGMGVDFLEKLADMTYHAYYVENNRVDYFKGPALAR